MKIILTGGCGFIGSHVAEMLVKEGHDTYVVDNLSTGRLENVASIINKIKFIQGDLSQKGSWQDCLEGAHGIIHLAALADIVPSIQKPEEYFHSNVDGTFNLLEAARKHEVKRFIYGASSSCYGIPHQYPTPETAPANPQYPYALTKWMGEEMVLHYNRVYKLPSLSLRFFNVYGPRSRTVGAYGALFGTFLKQKLEGKPFTIVGDGEQKRDFIYVTDVARALVTALRSSLQGEIYNVGTGCATSINEIVSLLQGPVVHIPKRPGEPDCTLADVQKIKRDLNWEAQISIQEGVVNLLKQIENWRTAPLWDAQSIALATKDWFHYLGETP